MHASISVHLSNEYFNTETEKWENNFDLFHEKVGKHKERLQNMYILFALISSAISDISELTKSIVFTQENSAEEEHIHVS